MLYVQYYLVYRPESSFPKLILIGEVFGRNSISLKLNKGKCGTFSCFPSIAIGSPSEKKDLWQ